MKFKVAYLVYYIVGMVLLSLGSVIVVPIVKNAGPDFAVVPFVISMIFLVVATFAVFWFSMRLVRGRYAKAKVDIAAQLGELVTSNQLTYPDPNQILLTGAVNEVKTEVLYRPLGPDSSGLAFNYWVYHGVLLVYIRANIEGLPEGEVATVKGAWENLTAKYNGKVQTTDKWISWMAGDQPAEAAGSLIKQLTEEINKRAGRQ